MVNRNRQEGWTKIGVFGVLFSVLIGAVLAVYLTNDHSSVNRIDNPLYLIGMLLLPLTFAVNLFSKLGDLKILKGLSRAEARRLSVIVDGKMRQVRIAIVMYVFSAVLILTLFFLFQGNDDFYRPAIIIAFGMLGGNLFSVILMLYEFQEVSNFRGKIHQREQDRKSRIAGFRKLNIK